VKGRVKNKKEEEKRRKAPHLGPPRRVFDSPEGRGDKSSSKRGESQSEGELKQNETKLPCTYISIVDYKSIERRIRL